MARSPVPAGRSSSAVDRSSGGQAPVPARSGTRLSNAGVAGLAVLAVVVGVAGAFTHRWASPLGLLLAVGGAAGVAVLTRACAGSRVGSAVVAVMWLAPVLALAHNIAGGDLVISGDEAGLVFLFGGVISHAVALGLGAEARKSGRFT